ncbi:MAG: methylated-DNA--[protein]-cysteine S-methyltransferase [Hyphomicrobiales bacterium]
MDQIDSPIGRMILLARDGVLLLLEFEEVGDRVARELKSRFDDYSLVPTPDPFGLSSRIRAYFAGDLSAIDGIATDGGGTDFQRRVWAELKRIPCGTTMSYGELARRLGDRNAMRAVGLANGRNPIAIVVPCHRVIGADGSMTGYGGGVERKKWLLAHEGLAVQGDLFGAA